MIVVCVYRYIDDLTIEFDRCQEAEHVRMEFFKKTLYKLKNALDISKNARYSIKLCYGLSNWGRSWIMFD